MSKHLDPTREWRIHKEGEPNSYFYCKYCNYHVTAEITRLKYHLTSIRNSVKIYERVPTNVKKSCQEMIQVIELEKKKLSLTCEIGRMSESCAEVIS